MNVPNTITMLRILMIPAFTICLLYDRLFLALVVFAAAGVSDALDGLLARAFNQKTPLGAYLDPIADKLLLSTAFVGLALLSIIPSWLTVLVITRDVIILLGFLVLLITSHRVEVRPTFTSKANTTFQIITITAALLAPYYGVLKGLLSILVWVTGALTCMSGLQYIRRGGKIINDKGG